MINIDHLKIPPWYQHNQNGEFSIITALQLIFEDQNKPIFKKKLCKSETNIVRRRQTCRQQRREYLLCDKLLEGQTSWFESSHLEFHLICHLWILPVEPFCYDFKKTGVSSTHLEWQTVTVAFIHFSNSGQQEDSKWYLGCRSFFFISNWPHWS